MTIHTRIVSTAGLHRRALIASPDRQFRHRLSEHLEAMNWLVHEVESGAQLWPAAQANRPDAVLVDRWLPDLDVTECVDEFRAGHPGIEIVAAEMNGAVLRSPYREQLLQALLASEDGPKSGSAPGGSCLYADHCSAMGGTDGGAGTPAPQVTFESLAEPAPPMPELVGRSASMVEVRRRIPAGRPAHDSGPYRRAYRHRQGTGRAGIASALRPQPPSVCGAELRRHTGNADRDGTVRP